MPRTPPKTKRRPLLEARTTVSLERGAYDALAEIAFERRISIGSVVREAVAGYLADRNPGKPETERRRK